MASDHFSFFFHIQKQRAGCIRVIHMHGTGHPISQIILRQQHMPHLFPDFRLIFLDPQNLRQSEPSHAMLVVIARNSSSKASVIVLHCSVVLTSFHRIALRRTLFSSSSTTKLCICPEKLIPSTCSVKSATSTLQPVQYISAEPGSDRPGSCSLQPDFG